MCTVVVVAVKNKAIVYLLLTDHLLYEKPIVYFFECVIELYRIVYMETSDTIQLIKTNFKYICYARGRHIFLFCQNNNTLLPYLIPTSTYFYHLLCITCLLSAHGVKTTKYPSWGKSRASYVDIASGKTFY